MRGAWFTASALLLLGLWPTRGAVGSVVPPLLIELRLGFATPVADGNDFVGTVHVRLPATPSAPAADRLVVRLDARGGTSLVGASVFVFDQPPVETELVRPIRVHLPKDEDGEVVAVAETFDAAGAKLWGRADSAFVLAGPGGVHVGTSSTYELAREDLTRQLASGRITRRAFDDATAALLSGARPATAVRGVARSVQPTPRAVVETTIANGVARYLVRGGATDAGPYRPIVGATVTFADRQSSGDAPLTSVPANVVTDANGRYGAMVPGKRADGTAVSLVVAVWAQSAVTTVGAIGQPQSPWGMSRQVDVTDAATTVDLDATPLIPNAHGAFSILDALTVARAAMVALRTTGGSGADPASKPLAFVEYPGDKANGSYFNDTPDAHLNIGQNHAFDWDVVFHEYGHYIQYLNGTSAGVGGQHYITGNNTGNNCLDSGAGGCTTPRGAPLTKDEGDRIAWGEGWPTFVGTVLQINAGAAAFGVPTAGDTRYDDTANSFGYDLENNASLAVGTGEDNELAVQRVLWDVADAPWDGSDEIAFGPNILWSFFFNGYVNGSSGFKPVTLSQFWSELLKGNPPEAVEDTYSNGRTIFQNWSRYGALSADHGVAPVPVAPDDNTVIDPDAPPTFRWYTQGAGGAPNPTASYGPSYRLNRFKVHFYDPNFTTELFTSPEIVTDGTALTAEYTPEVSDWKAKITSSGLIKWTVEGTADVAQPPTGPYRSKARTLRGVDVALILDDTASMSEEIAGEKQALDDFLVQLGAQHLPDPPVVELVTLTVQGNDAVNKLIQSTDVNAVRAALAQVGAGGGGSCPEASGEALFFTALDVAGSFGSRTGRRGQVILVTDASPHPGFDLSGGKALLAAKGIDLTVLLTGDCVLQTPSAATARATAVAPAPVCAGASNESDVCEPIVPDTECLVCQVGPGGGPADTGVFTLEGDGPVPSAVVAFSDLVAATGGVFAYHPEAKSGDLTAFTNIITNAALGAVLPRVVNATPTHIPAGAQVQVALAGRNTDFGPATVVTVGGDGVTVDAVDVQTPTDLRVILTIAPGATAGFRDVTATTPLADATEVALGTQVLAVDPPVTQPALVSVQPTLLARGTTVDIEVRGTGTSFAGGGSVPAFGSGVTVNGVTVRDATALVASVTVAPDAALGFRGASVTTGSEVATAAGYGPLVIVATLGAPPAVPAIADVTPGSGAPGATLDVAITGTSTGFVDGTSHAMFSGSGITVLSTSVADATHATAHVAVAADAAAGFRDVGVATGLEQVARRDAFEVRADSATTTTTLAHAATTSTTIPAGCGSAADCDDGDACTEDRCDGGQCSAVAPQGIAGALCRLGQAMAASVCAPEAVDPKLLSRMGRQRRRIQTLLGRVVKQPQRTAVLVGRAERSLDAVAASAQRLTTRKRHPLSAACAQRIRDAVGRVEQVLTGVR